MTYPIYGTEQTLLFYVDFLISIANTPFASLAAGLAKGPSQQPVWYNAALLAAAVTATGIFLTARFTAWQDRKNRRNALLASLLGEIAIIREEVRLYLQKLPPDLEKKTPPRTPPRIDKQTEPLMPTGIFEANVGSLGELGDSRLIEDITQLYAHIERVSAQSDQFAEGGQEVHPEYRRSLFSRYCSLLSSAVTVEYVLRKLLNTPRARAKDIIVPSLELQGKDKEDKELADNISGLLE